MSLSVTPGVIVERVGDDLMIIIPGKTDVVSLSGRPAELLLDVAAGRKVHSTDPALSDLLDLGIVSAPGLSRRGLIKAGAVGAGAGIAVLAMPSVAAASSSSSVGGSGQKPPGAVEISGNSGTIDGGSDISFLHSAVSGADLTGKTGTVYAGGASYNAIFGQLQGFQAVWLVNGVDLTVDPNKDWALTFVVGATTYWVTQGV